MALLSWFYSLIFINNKQIKLQSLILGFKRYYDDYPSLDGGFNLHHNNNMNHNNSTHNFNDYTQDDNHYTEIRNEHIPSMDDEYGTSQTSQLIPIDYEFNHRGSGAEDSERISALTNGSGSGSGMSGMSGISGGSVSNDDSNDADNELDDEAGMQRTEIYKIGELSDDLKWLVLNDYRFPLCMSDNELQLLSHNANMKVSKRQWFIIIIMLLQNSIHIGIEAAYIIWYTVYMSDKYDCSIIISTCQLTVLCFFAICGMACMKFLGEKFKYFANVGGGGVSGTGNNDDDGNDNGDENDDDDDGTGNGNGNRNRNGNRNTSTSRRIPHGYEPIGQDMSSNSGSNHHSSISLPGNVSVIEQDTIEVQMYDKVIRDNTTNSSNSYNRRFMHVRRRYDMCNAFVIMLIIGYIVVITLTVLVIPFNVLSYGLSEHYGDYAIETFWIYVSVLGFVWGMIAMAQEFIMLDIQAKHKFYRITNSPRIANVRESIKFMVRGCVVFAIGILWEKSFEWLWFAQGISFTICFSLLAVLIVEEVK